MKKLPKIINQEEFEKLHAEAMKIESKATPRRKKRIKQYRVAMILAFDAGMRISEIVGLGDRIKRLQKNQIEGNSIRIISGKGKKDRIVPKPKRFNKAAIDTLPLTISRRPLQDFVKKLGEKVLNKDISFHTLRHGFATHLINSGMPLHQVQMFMGHSRMDTTGIYLHSSPQEALNKYQEVF